MIWIFHVFASQIEGSIMLPNISNITNTVEPSAMDSSCYLYTAGTDAASFSPLVRYAKLLPQTKINEFGDATFRSRRDTPRGAN